MGPERGSSTSRWGSGTGDRLSRLVRLLVGVGSGHRGDELTGLFEVALLDQDLELGQPVDRQRIDERRGPAADHDRDAMAFQEVLDQVRFERAVNARDLGQVGAVALGMVVMVVRHGRGPFFEAR